MLAKSDGSPMGIYGGLELRADIEGVVRRATFYDVPGMPPSVYGIPTMARWKPDGLEFPHYNNGRPGSQQSDGVDHGG